MKVKLITKNKGYTLAEVVVASCLLGVILGGVAALMATMEIQERSARTNAVALNYVDNAAFLWQLGLPPAEVQALLPSTVNNPALEEAIVPVSASEMVGITVNPDLNLSNSMGVLESATVAVTIRNPQGGANRTFPVQAYQPKHR